MSNSQTKSELIIDVWEKLDCESVGRKEIEAIIQAVENELGVRAVESPMIIARLLADEGAHLRHPEILALDVERRLESPYLALFDGALRISSFDETLSSIDELERQKARFVENEDMDGIRRLRDLVLNGKQRALEIAKEESISRAARNVNLEIAEWLSIWLASPKVFEGWVKLRRNSSEFRKKFKTR